jgi:recombination protein RecR
MKHYPKTITTLLHHLKKLPSVGQKTALRYAFEILSWRKSEVNSLLKTLQDLETLKKCISCGYLHDHTECPLCDRKSRDFKKLCIVGSLKDIFTIEGTKIYHGTYFILTNLLSPLDELQIEKEEINKIIARIKNERVSEVIMALEPTIQGDATTLFLSEEFRDLPIKLSRLALGIPVGTSLEYVDDGTLHQAFSYRQSL